jgi:hypothetical protein
MTLRLQSCRFIPGAICFAPSKRPAQTRRAAPHPELIGPSRAQCNAPSRPRRAARVHSSIRISSSVPECLSNLAANARPLRASARPLSHCRARHFAFSPLAASAWRSPRVHAARNRRRFRRSNCPRWWSSRPRLLRHLRRRRRSAREHRQQRRLQPLLPLLDPRRKARSRRP